MDEHKLTEFLQSRSADVPERTRFCPDDEQITEYFEGSLGTQNFIALKHHLVECRFCMARIGNLERLTHVHTDQTEDCWVRGTILADAKSMGDRPLPSRSWAAPSLTTAALLVLTLSTISMLGIWPNRDASITVPEADTHQAPLRQVRSIDATALAPHLISPVDGATIGLDNLTIRWAHVKNSLHYDVRVLDAMGFIVISQRVENVTEIHLPVEKLLEHGKTYYIRVDAYLAQANSISSEHTLFTVKELTR